MSKVEQPTSSDDVKDDLEEVIGRAQYMVIALADLRGLVCGFVEYANVLEGKYLKALKQHEALGGPSVDVEEKASALRKLRSDVVDGEKLKTRARFMEMYGLCQEGYERSGFCQEYTAFSYPGK